MNPIESIPNDLPTNFLIIHTGALGDVICALTAIECFFSQKMFDFCCQGHIAPLFEIVPNIRNVFDINNPMISSVFMSVTHPDIIDWLIKYPCILLISFSEDWERCLNKYNRNIIRIPPRPPVNETVHTVQFIMDALQRKSLESRNNSGIQDFILQKKHRSYKKLNECLWKSVCIHPGSGSVFKNWPIECYLTLSKRLIEKGHSVGWILGPAEYELMKVLIQNKVNLNDIVQTHHIQTIIKYLTQSDHFVGNDSGISHLAAYMGVDTTAIFGPSDFRRWRPIGVCVKTIPDTLPLCSPCFEKGNRHCSHKKCLNDVSVSHVISNIFQLI
jgi:ADP-heptose:LPS heptosyltransferase